MATAHEEIHGEHRLWLSESSMWRDDVSAWDKEIDQALDGLGELEAAVREHRQSLQGHLDAIAAEERAWKDHEHTLAQFEQFEQAGVGDELLRLAKARQKRAEGHARQRQAHEQFKRHHHTVMAYWSLLHKTLTRQTDAL